MSMADVDLDKKYNCDECRRKGKEKRRNCDGEQVRSKEFSGRVYILDAVPRMYVDMCPRRLIEEAEERLEELFEAFAIYQATKTLPYFGGTKDQPAVTLEAILFCKALYNALECDSKFNEWRNRKDKRRENGIENPGQKQVNTLADALKLRGKRKA